jgi:radical SAM-linked protein
VSWHLLHFSRTGAARYLSHLDTARALQRTFARAGVPIALSRGMRPKPRLSLVLPLPVGAAALCEPAVVELADAEQTEEAAPGGRLARLRAAAPEGLGIEALEPAAARPRPVAVSADYECELVAKPERLAQALAWFEEQEHVTTKRTSPKGTKSVDLRHYVGGVSVKRSHSGSLLGFTVRYESAGAARPEEFVRLLAVRAGADPVMRDLVRTRVAYRESRGHGRAGEE